MSSSSSLMEQLRHELLGDVSDHVAAELKAFGIEADKADQIGVNIANHLAEHWGGQLISFPKDQAFRLHVRDLEIFTKFNGSNHGALAREYDLTLRSIYTIVERTRRRQLDKMQGHLF